MNKIVMNLGVFIGIFMGEAYGAIEVSAGQALTIKTMRQEINKLVKKKDIHSLTSLANTINELYRGGVLEEGVQYVAKNIINFYIPLVEISLTKKQNYI